MTAQLQATSSSSNLLRETLLANALFSAMSGLLFLFASGKIADFMGLESGTPFIVIGVLLLIWAVDVFWVASRSPINRAYARAIMIGDLIWVIGSAIVLLLNPFDFSTNGIWAVLIVADIVLLFTILEYLGLRRLS